MTTTYYISYQIRKSNHVTQWFNSKEVESLQEAEKIYQKIEKKHNCISIRFFQKDHYQAEELRPTYQMRYPEGADSYSYIKCWDRI